MKKCNKCNVKVSTTRKTCPLCGDFLDVVSNDPVLTSYPEFKPHVHKRNLFLRILLFVLIVGAGINVLINVVTYEGRLWSLYVVGGSIYIWMLFKSTILSKKPIAKKLIIQMIFISMLVGIVDFVSNNTIINGWSVSYVIPALSIATTIANIIVVMIKRMKYSDYISYFIGTIFLGFAPIVLVLIGLTNIIWPSLVSAFVSITIILGMIIFGDRQTKDEIKKRLHI